MSLNIFAEIARTNAAYCAAHGLSGAELYGTPINAEEYETHKLIAAGVPSEAAIPKFRPRKAKHLRYWPRTPIQQLGYIEAFLQQCGCTPREHPEYHQPNGEKK